MSLSLSMLLSFSLTRFRFAISANRQFIQTDAVLDHRFSCIEQLCLLCIYHFPISNSVYISIFVCMCEYICGCLSSAGPHRSSVEINTAFHDGKINCRLRSMFLSRARSLALSSFFCYTAKIAVIDWMILHRYFCAYDQAKTHWITTIKTYSNLQT